MSNFRKLELDPVGAPWTPSNQLRVSESYNIFDSKLVSDKAELFWDEVTSGTATSAHNSGEASVSMSVSANNDYVIRQTFMPFNYQPRKVQDITLTGMFTNGVANTEAMWGYMNTFGASAPYTANRDGIYFGTDGTDRYVAWAKNGTEYRRLESAWNYGNYGETGKPSDYPTFDWSDNCFFFIRFLWLGVGVIQWGTIVRGVEYTLHIEHFNNGDEQTSGAYLASPNHSLRYELRSTGGTATIKQICCSVQSEGGVEPAGVTRAVNVDATTQSIGATKEAMIGIRLKDTHLCSVAQIVAPTLMPTGNEDTLWELQLNPTYSNSPTWNSAGKSSPIEYAVGDGANNVTTDGEVLACGYASDDTNVVNLLVNTIIHLGSSIDGTKDELWLVVKAVTGSGSYVGGLNLRELTCG